MLIISLVVYEPLPVSYKNALIRSISTVSVSVFLLKISFGSFSVIDVFFIISSRRWFSLSFLSGLSIPSTMLTIPLLTMVKNFPKSSARLRLLS